MPSPEELQTQNVSPAELGRETNDNTTSSYCDMVVLGAFAPNLPTGTSDDIRNRIESLRPKYSWIRQVVSDDKQFYSSFLFAYVEKIWLYQDYVELNRITTKLQYWKDQVQDSITETSGFVVSMTNFLDLLNEILNGVARPISHLDFLQRMLSVNIKPIVLLFAKIATLQQLAWFGMFSQEPDPDFCSNIRAYSQLTTISNALGLHIHVEVMSGHPPIDFLPAATNSTPINLLYFSDLSGRKDHYYILYTPSFMDKYDLKDYWSNLPPEILGEINKHMPSIDAFLVFKRVCKRWWTAAQPHLVPIQPPLLMLGHDVRKKKTWMYSLVSRKASRYNFSSLVRRKPIFGSEGWLLTHDMVIERLVLVNPLINREYRLPVFTVGVSWERIRGRFLGRPNEASCRVFIELEMADDSILSLDFRHGDSDWRSLNIPRSTIYPNSWIATKMFEDVIFYCDPVQGVYSFNTTTSVFTQLTAPPRSPSQNPTPCIFIEYNEQPLLLCNDKVIYQLDSLFPVEWTIFKDPNAILMFRDGSSPLLSTFTNLVEDDEFEDASSLSIPEIHPGATAYINIYHYASKRLARIKREEDKSAAVNVMSSCKWYEPRFS